MNKPTEKKLKTYVLMLAKTMPMTHSAAGQPTGFVKLIVDGEKRHTLRMNYDLWRHRVQMVNSGKAVISVRQWTGAPYQSKQHEVFQMGANEVSISSARRVSPDVWMLDETEAYPVKIIAQNDGLDVNDFCEFFEDVTHEDMLACIHFDKFKKGKQCKYCTYVGEKVSEHGFCSHECHEAFDYKPDIQFIRNGSHGTGSYDVNTGEFLGNLGEHYK